MPKIYSILAVIMMITVGGIVVFNESDNADALNETSTTGLVKVNYYDGEDWSATPVAAFDVYQAVVAAQDELGYEITVAGDNATYNTYVDDPYYPYYDIDADYGTLATVNGSTNFSVKVYNGSAWVAAQPALGWYRPFADYAEKVTFANGASAGAANVAIIAGSSDATPVSETISFTAIDRTSSDFAYSFTLVDDYGLVEDSSFVSGQSMPGYGSDAYLALLDAYEGKILGQAVCVIMNGEGDYAYNTYYSWIDKIFGVGTETDVVDGVYVYTYWASYNADVSGYAGYLDYTLGYYSKLAGAPNYLDHIKFEYTIS